MRERYSDLTLPFCEDPLLDPICNPIMDCPSLSISSTLISAQCLTAPMDIPVVEVKRRSLRGDTGYSGERVIMFMIYI